MPLYEFECNSGHVTELVRPIGTEAVSCPTCKPGLSDEMRLEWVARRRLVAAPAMIVGPTLHPNLTRPQKYRDAHERAEHGFRQVGARRP